MDAKHYKNCQNNHKYLSKYEDDEFIIDRKIRRNYRRYRKNMNVSTDSESLEEEKEKEKSTVKNSTVKKVIEKFNRLSYHISKPRLCDKPPEQIKISTPRLIPEKVEKVEKVSEIEEQLPKMEVCESENKKKEIKKLKCSGNRKLRCSERMNPTTSESKDFSNMFKVPDEYIRFIDDIRRRNVIKYTPKNTLENLQLSKNELKHFKSTKTQTSPYASNTNILINVYNAPDPRIFSNMQTCNDVMQLRVSLDDQFRFSIAEAPHDSHSNAIESKKKKCVKNCVQDFQDFVKNKNVKNNRKIIASVPKIEKYKCKPLTKEVSAILLSPRAKSEPF